MEVTMTDSLDREALERLRPHIELELHRRLQVAAKDGLVSIAAVLREIFPHLCGHGRSESERHRFLAFAAPIGREVAIACAMSGQLAGQDPQRVIAFAQWFRRVQGFDPLCTRMIDLFYFGGLGPRRTSALVGISRRALIRELRFAKAWWMQARMRQAC
jgi:ECF sigma factor